jgi:predicted PurR-regulated permease PerM
MTTEWSYSTKRLVVIGLILLGILILYLSRAIITSLVLAGILAFLLNPIIKLLMLRLRMPRWLAVLLCYLLLLIALLLTPLLLTPAVVHAIQDIDIDFVTLWDNTVSRLQQFLQGIRYIEVLGFQVDLSTTIDPILDMLSGVVPEGMTPSLENIFSSIPSVFQLATGVASTVVSTVLTGAIAIGITLIFSIYMSLDLPHIHQSLLNLVPMPHRPEYAALVTRIQDVWNAYLRGQVLLMLIVGAMTFAGNLVLGMPGALLLGIAAGLLEVLPNVGPVLAAIPALAVALLQGSTVLPVSNVAFAVIIAVFYIIVQQIENNLIVPRVIGDAIEVHPILVMAGVITGATIGGLFGALIAAPLLATLRVLSQFVYSKLLGQPPFPPPPQEPSPPPNDEAQPEEDGSAENEEATQLSDE